MKHFIYIYLNNLYEYLLNQSQQILKILTFKGNIIIIINDDNYYKILIINYILLL